MPDLNPMRHPHKKVRRFLWITLIILKIILLFLEVIKRCLDFSW